MGIFRRYGRDLHRLLRKRSGRKDSPGQSAFPGTLSASVRQTDSSTELILDGSPDWPACFPEGFQVILPRSPRIHRSGNRMETSNRQAGPRPIRTRWGRSQRSSRASFGGGSARARNASHSCSQWGRTRKRPMPDAFGHHPLYQCSARAGRFPACPFRHRRLSRPVGNRGPTPDRSVRSRPA